MPVCLRFFALLDLLEHFSGLRFSLAFSSFWSSPLLLHPQLCLYSWN